MIYSNTENRLPRKVTFTDAELDRILQKITEKRGRIQKPKPLRIKSPKLEKRG